MPNVLKLGVLYILDFEVLYAQYKTTGIHYNIWVTNTTGIQVFYLILGNMIRVSNNTTGNILREAIILPLLPATPHDIFVM